MRNLFRYKTGFQPNNVWYHIPFFVYGIHGIYAYAYMVGMVWYGIYYVLIYGMYILYRHLITRLNPGQNRLGPPMGIPAKSGPFARLG